jgi:hypothetical protein
MCLTVSAVVHIISSADKVQQSAPAEHTTHITLFVAAVVLLLSSSYTTAALCLIIAVHTVQAKLLFV